MSRVFSDPREIYENALLPGQVRAHDAYEQMTRTNSNPRQISCYQPRQPLDLLGQMRVVLYEDNSHTRPPVVVFNNTRAEWKLETLAADFGRLWSDLLADIGSLGIGWYRFALNEGRVVREIRDLAARARTTPIVIGHSLGGVMAQTLAAVQPDLVGGVVTFGSPGVHGYLRTRFANAARPPVVVHYRFVGEELITGAGGERLPGLEYVTTLKESVIDQLAATVAEMVATEIGAGLSELARPAIELVVRTIASHVTRLYEVFEVEAQRGVPQVARIQGEIAARYQQIAVGATAGREAGDHAVEAVREAIGRVAAGRLVPGIPDSEAAYIRAWEILKALASVSGGAENVTRAVGRIVGVSVPDDLVEAVEIAPFPTISLVALAATLARPDIRRNLEMLHPDQTLGVPGGLADRLLLDDEGGLTERGLEILRSAYPNVPETDEAARQRFRWEFAPDPDTPQAQPRRGARLSSVSRRSHQLEWIVGQELRLHYRATAQPAPQIHRARVLYGTRRVRRDGGDVRQDVILLGDFRDDPLATGQPEYTHEISFRFIFDFLARLSRPARVQRSTRTGARTSLRPTGPVIRVPNNDAAAFRERLAELKTLSVMDLWKSAAGGHTSASGRLHLREDPAFKVAYLRTHIFFLSIRPTPVLYGDPLELVTHEDLSSATCGDRVVRSLTFREFGGLVRQRSHHVNDGDRWNSIRKRRWYEFLVGESRAAVDNGVPRGFLTSYYWKLETCVGAGIDCRNRGEGTKAFKEIGYQRPDFVVLIPVERECHVIDASWRWDHPIHNIKTETYASVLRQALPQGWTVRGYDVRSAKHARLTSAVH